MKINCYEMICDGNELLRATNIHCFALSVVANTCALFLALTSAPTWGDRGSQTTYTSLSMNLLKLNWVL